MVVVFFISHRPQRKGKGKEEKKGGKNLYFGRRRTKKLEGGRERVRGSYLQFDWVGCKGSLAVSSGGENLLGVR